MSVRYAVPQEKLVGVLIMAFNLSKPQGLGFLHFTPGVIDRETEQDLRDRARKAIDADPAKPYFKAIHLDYVQGRACKFSIRFDGIDGWFIEGPKWYDHSSEDLLELVKVCELELIP